VSGTTEARRNSTARKIALAIGAAVVAGVFAFALIGGGPPSTAGGAPGSSESDRSSEGTTVGGSTDSRDSSTDQDDGGASGTNENPTATNPRSSSSSSQGAGGGGSTSGGSPGGSSDSSPTDPVGGVVDDIKELTDSVVGEIADQLGETVDTVGGTLGGSGVDLDAVTEDVLDLVEQGVSLEDAVDQVLGLLALPAADPTPAPSGGGGLVGGVLGQL